MRTLSIAVIAACSSLLATPAAAAQYTFSYGFGSTTYASGSIFTDTTQPCGTGCFVVSNVTGSNRGAAITGFDPFDLQSDQYLYPTRTGAYVDGSGLTYSVGSTSYNIYSVGSGNYNEFHFDTATGTQIGSSQFVTFFTLQPAVTVVPEPASWAMMIAGFAAAGGALRRRRVRVALAA